MTPNQVVIVEEITTLPCWPNPSGHARFARGYAGAGTRSTRTCVPPSPLTPKQRRVDDGWLEDDRRNSVRSGSLYTGAVFRSCPIVGEVTARPSFDGWSFMGTLPGSHRRLSSETVTSRGSLKTFRRVVTWSSYFRKFLFSRKRSRYAGQT